MGDGAHGIDGLDGGLLRGDVAKKLLPLAGELDAVVPVHIVGAATDLVEEDPAQLAVEGDGLRVGGDAAVAEEVDAATDPFPAFLGGMGGDGDVVGHVPGLELPDGGGGGHEGGDGLGEGVGLKELAVVLELGGAVPKVIDEEAAEGSKGGGHEDHGRGGGSAKFTAEAEFVVGELVVGEVADAGRGGEEASGEEKGNELEVAGRMGGRGSGEF